jgi:formate dehydrogenase maturation protein FdhE
MNVLVLYEGESVCEKCQGEGDVSIFVGSHYTDVRCSNCGGTGKTGYPVDAEQIATLRARLANVEQHLRDMDQWWAGRNNEVWNKLYASQREKEAILSALAELVDEGVTSCPYCGEGPIMDVDTLRMARRILKKE